MIRVNIETPTISDFEAVMASLRGFGPARLIQGDLMQTVANDVLPIQVDARGMNAEMNAAREIEGVKSSTEPTTRKRRTKAEIEADNAREAAATKPVDNVELPADEEPAASETTLAEDVAAAEANVAPSDPAGGALDSEALNKLVRAKLKEVRDTFDAPKMLGVLNKFGFQAVKDAPDAKLPAIIAECDAILKAG